MMMMIMGTTLLMEMVIMIFEQDFNVDIQQSPHIMMLCPMHMIMTTAMHNPKYDDDDAQSQR